MEKRLDIISPNITKLTGEEARRKKLSDNGLILVSDKKAELFIKMRIPYAVAMTAQGIV